MNENEDISNPGKNTIEQNNDIEESIIEEDIVTNSQIMQSPSSPLITSKTKQKGKMGLFMMKPPKPFK